MDQQIGASLPSFVPSVSLRSLSNSDLVERIKGLVCIENKALALLIAHLVELDRRRLYADLGYSSLFAYCTRALGYSEDSACKRILAARAAAKFPMVLALLDEGKLHLAAIVLLSPHLTDENHAQLLITACGKRKRELESLCASLEPATTEPSDMMRMIAPGRVVFGFAADEELRDDVERARQLLRHKHPSGRIEFILAEALQMLLGAKDPDFWTLDRKPAREPKRTGRRCRYIPRSVKESVWKRDQGRCAFKNDQGSRCDERSWLEFDHITPWACGGRSDDPDNIRLLCATHNQLLARRAFGEAAAHRRGKYPPRGG